MKKLVILLALAPAMLLMSAAFNKKTGIEIGENAPLTKTKMTNVDGKKYTLEGLKKEKGLVVVFSCNTCPFVVGSKSFAGWEKDYNSLSELANQKDLGFVLINANEAKRKDEDSLEEMKKRAKEKEYKMPYLVDKKSALADAFGAKTTPHVFVFDENMKLIYNGSIDNSWDSKREEDVSYLKNVMTQLSANQTITTAQTPPRGCSIKRK